MQRANLVGDNANQVLKDWMDGKEDTLLLYTDLGKLYGKHNFLFVRLPLDDSTDRILYSSVDFLEHGGAVIKQILLGYWVKQTKVLMQVDNNDYAFPFDCLHEDGKNFVKKETVEKELNTLARHKLCEALANKYALSDWKATKELSKSSKEDMDIFWLQGKMPKDVLDYMEHFSDCKELTFAIEISTLIRYLAGNRETVFTELLAPYLDEEDSSTRYDLRWLKTNFAIGQTMMKSLPSFKPSKRAMYTKKIVDAVNAYMNQVKKGSIKKLRLKVVYEGKVYDGTLSWEDLVEYKKVYSSIRTNVWFNKFYCDGERLEDIVFAENVLEISYSRKVIYAKEEVLS